MGFTDNQINRMGYIASLGYGFQGNNSTKINGGYTVHDLAGQKA